MMFNKMPVDVIGVYATLSGKKSFYLEATEHFTVTDNNFAHLIFKGERSGFMDENTVYANFNNAFWITKDVELYDCYIDNSYVLSDKKLHIKNSSLLCAEVCSNSSTDRYDVFSDLSLNRSLLKIENYWNMGIAVSFQSIPILEYGKYIYCMQEIGNKPADYIINTTNSISAHVVCANINGRPLDGNIINRINGRY